MLIRHERDPQGRVDVERGPGERLVERHDPPVIPLHGKIDDQAHEHPRSERRVRLTLERTIAKIDTLETRITDFEQHLDNNPELDFDSLTPDAFEDPDFEQKREQYRRVKEFFAAFYRSGRGRLQEGQQRISHD